MKGVVNKGIQELVEAKFGAEAWQKVKELAVASPVVNR